MTNLWKHAEDNHEQFIAQAIACVASVSVGFGSKERPRKRIFGILPAQKMGREPKEKFVGDLLLSNGTEMFAMQATEAIVSCLDISDY